MINLGKQAFRVEKGLRIAQMVICPILRAELEEVAELGQREALVVLDLLVLSNLKNENQPLKNLKDLKNK